MNFIKTDDATAISAYRKELYQTLKAPIDAEWEEVNVALAQPYFITHNDSPIGYCCINEDQSLMQVFLNNRFNHQMNQIILSLIDSGYITSATMGSCEPVSFNACLRYANSLTTHTFCYEYARREANIPKALNLEQVGNESIPTIQSFFSDQLGFEDNFGYTQNLVDRGEIFMLREGGTVIATSECRFSDSQPTVASLGMIVHADYRGKGIATQILRQQAQRALEAGRNPICATTAENIASQKAIEKAGFYCSSIMFNMHFEKGK